jgi:hypothetical protein
MPLTGERIYGRLRRLFSVSFFSFWLGFLLDAALTMLLSFLDLPPFVVMRGVGSIDATNASCFCPFLLPTITHQQQSPFPCKCPRLTSRTTKTLEDHTT